SFEIDPLNEDSKLIDFDSLLVIFVNGILQKPKDSYSFSGGTSFIFNTPPKPEDKIDIFFYRGTRGIDSDLENVFETIKIGDNVSLLHNSNYPKTIDQDNRVIFEILTSDLVETNLYSGVGIDDEIFKPIDIIPQKSDKIINSTYVSKSRDSLSSLVFPTSKIIKNVLSSDTEIFVDDASSFNYEENTDPENNSIISFDALLTVSIDPVIASLKANVLNDSSISISILDGGSGYIPSSTVTLDISTPSSGIGVGIGTTAQATALVSVAGTISSINIINSGFGYTSIPQVISPLPSSKIETISEIKFVQGFSGIITGITTTSGTNSNPLALKFFLKKESGNFNTLLTSYPIFISNTQNQNGVISINNDDNDVVGIGTTFLDNIYYVHSINRNGLDAEIVTNIKSDSIISSGFSTSGPNLGRFSWGRLSSFERSNPNNFDVSGNIVSGLSSYPQIQRRGYGLRNTGSFKNQL
ncbi:MAG: hypothetical protein EBS55_11990, partial [Flavobacteriaceae bacterium]|nr:hypothetical protein [Flavobacteriaceae bacterium]